MADEEEQEPETKSTPQYMRGRPEVMAAVFGQVALRREILSAEKKKAHLELYIKDKRSAIKEIEVALGLKRAKLSVLQEVSDTINSKFEEGLKIIEKKRARSETLIKKSIESKQENSALTKRLNEEKMTLKGEISQIEEVLNKYVWYGTILFKLSPPEWQEAQTESLTAKDAQKKRSSGSKGQVESSPLTTEATSSSNESTNFTLDGDSTVEEDKLKLYFSDAPQVGALLTELTDQILSLNQNSTVMDKTLAETIEITRNKMEEEEEKLALQVRDTQDRIESEKKREVRLKKKVQLHNSLKTKDQDIMLHALARKVAEVHSFCTDNRLANLHALEKLSAIEHLMFMLLQEIERIPEETLKTLQQIKENERRIRLQMEKVKLQNEKRREMMSKCMKKALGEAKKITGRRLMPRCIPVKQKTQDDEPPVPQEDNLHDYLFSEDSN